VGKGFKVNRNSPKLNKGETLEVLDSLEQTYEQHQNRSEKN